MLSFLKKLFKKIPIGYYKEAYFVRGIWQIKNSRNVDIRKDFCGFSIVYNRIKNHYKLNYTGYLPTKHKAYKEMVEAVNDLNAGKKIIINKKLINVKK
jgi:hypothetical protein